MLRPYRRSRLRPISITVAVVALYLLFCLCDLSPFGIYTPFKFSSSSSSSARNADRKTLVVASTSADNTTWFHEDLPEWEKAIYVVDDPNAPLTVPTNKGRESMVYLTYVARYLSFFLNLFSEAI